jgi:hypothetical protein
MPLSRQETPLAASACWYNVDTFTLSEGRGYHVARPPPPGDNFLSLPYKCQVKKNPTSQAVRDPAKRKKDILRLFLSFESEDKE